MLFSEPKIPQSRARSKQRKRRNGVSVLFSEPKIPQLTNRRLGRDGSDRFQCSSASRKFLNAAIPPRRNLRRVRFSALQRAENSSIVPGVLCVFEAQPLFQCSSASRKFLNLVVFPKRNRRHVRFSALQRAENSSIGRLRRAVGERDRVSVLFSEPKIPQSRRARARNRRRRGFSALQRAENSSIGGGQWIDFLRVAVSVLFSEPKIPQCVR